MDFRFVLSFLAGFLAQPPIIYLPPRLLCLCLVGLLSQEEQQSGRDLDGDEMYCRGKRRGEVMDYR